MKNRSTFGKLTNIIFSAGIMVLTSCTGGNINDTTIDSQKSPSGTASVAVNVGKIGQLAKHSAIEMEKLIIEIKIKDSTSAIIKDTSTLSGSGAVVIKKTFPSLTAPENFVLQAKAFDKTGKLIHSGIKEFSTIPADTVDVSLDLDAMYSMLKVAFNNIPDSVSKVRLRIAAIDTLDSAFTRGTRDTIVFHHDYIPADKNGITHAISLEASGSFYGKDTVLFSADTIVLAKAGKDTSYKIVLKWVGPGVPKGAATMTVIIGSVGTTLVNAGFASMAGETGYVWNKIITSGPPRSGVAAYDSDRHMAVMFACGNEDFSNSTWEFDGTTWREIAISGTRPHGRDHSCKIVYDAFHKKMIMQGGWWNDDNDNTTWEYKVTGTGPNDRAWVGIANVDCAFRGALAMAYDSKRHMILSFGGNHWQSFYNDTWQFNGNDNSWTKLNNWGPTRFGAGLVYDSKRDKFVMFGGVGRWWSGDYENGRGNTCEFDPESGIWKEIISEGTPGTPGPRLIPYNTMIYNQVEDITYLMGGNRNSDNFIFKDLWAYDGTSWTEIPSPSDSPSSGTLWYDTDAKKIMQYNAPNTYMLTKTAIE